MFYTFYDYRRPFRTKTPSFDVLTVICFFTHWQIYSRIVDADLSQAAHSPVGIYVITDATNEDYRQRVRMARSTWAHGLSVLFVSGKGDASLGIESIPCVEDASMFVVSCKTVNGLEVALQVFPRARWLVRAVDDTFVFPDHLEHELRVFDAREQVFVGAPSVSLLCSEPNHAPACGDVHAAGGAGMIFSRPLAEEFVRLKQVFLNAAGNTNDDVHVGHFLRYALDAHVHSLPGIKQEPRFEQMLLGRFSIFHGNIPHCSRPFPRPVYSEIEDWGSLYPWTPIDTRRLLMLHSNPDAWADLNGLRIIENEVSDLAHGGLSLMAFVRTKYRKGEALQPITSHHFKDIDALHICAYNPHDRLSSFDMAANRDRYFSFVVPDVLVSAHNLTAIR